MADATRKGFAGMLWVGVVAFVLGVLVGAMALSGTRGAGSERSVASGSVAAPAVYVYQRDDPAGLQPYMRGMAVALLAVQASLERGYPRAAQPYVEALQTIWTSRPVRSLPERDFGRRFAVLDAELRTRIAELSRATSTDDLQGARDAYFRLVSTCVTCHHQADRAEHVVLGRLAAGF